jgi:GNAT superfamily N-acetyltransferase
MVEIELVRTAQQAEMVYDLAYEFIDWLRRRYPELDTHIDNYLAHQKFDEQIKAVLTHYNPPNGECLLAKHDDAPIGLLMLKNLRGGVCEMNRMYVRESARGLGAGRALLNRLTERAKEMDFNSMVLSALPRHHEAISLYQSFGFRLDDRPRGADNAENAVLMRLDLSAK